MSRPPVSIVAIQIAALVSLAISYPALEVLGRSPEFFIAQRLEGTDLVAFVLIVAVALPGAVAVIAFLAGLVSCRLLSAIAGPVRPLLAAAIVLQAIRGLPASGLVLVFAAVAAGVAFEVACRRFRPVGLFLVALSPVLAVAPAIFCLWSPASRL